MLTVYHGATCKVEKPLCHIGRDNLDFGKGFYVTDLKEQAVSWATRFVNIGLLQWLNVYNLDIEQVRQQFRCLRFEAYDKNWLDFIASSRKGLKPWEGYDLIEGGVADDVIVPIAVPRGHDNARLTVTQEVGHHRGCVRAERDFRISAV